MPRERPADVERRPGAVDERPVLHRGGLGREVERRPRLLRALLRRVQARDEEAERPCQMLPNKIPESVDRAKLSLKNSKSRLKMLLLSC